MIGTLDRPQARALHRRYWSAEEDATLRRLFDRSAIMASCERIARELSRTPLSVHFRATKLHLCGNTGRKSKHAWTEDELMILHRDFPIASNHRRALAARLGVSLYQLQYQAARQGILKASDYGRRVWTVQEDSTLREYVHRETAKALARRLGRSMNSVTVRIKRLGLNRRIRDGWYTKAEACELLGVDHKWLQRRIDAKALTATFHHDVRPSQSGMRMWHIAEADLRDFVCRYPEELNGRNVDMIGLVELLAGIKMKV